MCGRARLSSDWSEIKIQLGISIDTQIPNFAAHWNAAPTQDLPVARFDAAAGGRRLDLMRWGLVPFWAKDIKVGYSTFNAKAETVAGKPAFREPFRRRRCLVPVDSFYEWQKRGPSEKQPYAIALKSGRLMVLAGLWDAWKSPAGETLLSFTILTGPANDLMARVHDRMPVILPEAAWGRWLGETPATQAELQALLVPCPSDDLVAWPVDKRVGNVRNDDPGLIAPVAA